MELKDWAHLILFGTTLEEKLSASPLDSTLVNSILDENDIKNTDFTRSIKNKPFLEIAVPHFPGRPARLSKIGKAPFPSLHQLKLPVERGRILHFFANHELLAMELMALAILRFPEAPHSFRKGLARIIGEEQSHLKLYISRMNELGIELGDLPVSDYFWNCMKGMTSPLDFTVQMSLTFEQANLDFSLFFKNAIQKTGDEATAALLERVYLEEIQHVKHGLTWFNRWRGNNSSESDWDAYNRLLPMPLTPQRAKGFEYCEEVRRTVGFSEIYIRELRLHSSSKGRPPVLWYFNPHCDSEISRGTPGFTPNLSSQSIANDLQHIPLFIALNQDIVLVRDRPRLPWIESLQDSGVALPEFVTINQLDLSSPIRPQKIGGLQPWGWSPDVFKAFNPLRSRLVDIEGGNSPFCREILDKNDFYETGIGKFFSKAWSVAFLEKWIAAHPNSQSYFGELKYVGNSYSNWDSAFLRVQTLLNEGSFVMIKAPYGTAGKQIKRVTKISDLNKTFIGWIQKIIFSQGSIIIEELLDKIADFSMQFEVHTNRIQLFEARRFMTGSRNEYRGSYLGRKHLDLNPEQTQFFHALLPQWHDFVRDLGSELRQGGYLGPAGIDALLWKDKSGALKFKPLIELNPRWTMGRVALELEKLLAPGIKAQWLFMPVSEVKKSGHQDVIHFAQGLINQYPILKTQTGGGGEKILSGVLFTNDPATANAVLTFIKTQL